MAKLWEKIRLFSYATSLGHAHSLLFYYPAGMYIDAMPFYTDEQNAASRVDRALRAHTFKGWSGRWPIR